MYKVEIIRLEWFPKAYDEIIEICIIFDIYKGLKIHHFLNLLHNEIRNTKLKVESIWKKCINFLCEIEYIFPICQIQSCHFNQTAKITRILLTKEFLETKKILIRHFKQIKNFWIFLQ